MSQEEIERIRKINSTKAHGHIDSAVSHCAFLLSYVDGLAAEGERLKESREASRRLYELAYNNELRWMRKHTELEKLNAQMLAALRAVQHPSNVLRQSVAKQVDEAIAAATAQQPNFDSESRRKDRQSGEEKRPDDNQSGRYRGDE